MKLLRIALVIAASLLGVQSGYAQTTILPPGNVCFSASTGLNGLVGLLGTISGGSGFVTGTYGGVALTGGTGTGATANITVGGGAVTNVSILNPGTQYTVGDTLSASTANIGGSGTGFSVPVASVNINSNLAAGTVGFYIPNTLTFKTTWKNSNQSTVNTNPVRLDGNGCALIYGLGSYRQIVKDSLGNTVWDAVTASTAALSTTQATSGSGDFLAVGAIQPIAGFVAPTNYVFAFGQELARASYPDALAALTISTAASCVSGNTTISGLSSTAQMRPGSPVEGVCIAPGSTISSIGGPTSIVLSIAATSTGSVTIRVFPYGNGNASTTFNVPDLRGRVMPGADAIGGTAANRLTSTYYGASAATPGVSGGSQSVAFLQANLPSLTWPIGTLAISDTRVWQQSYDILTAIPNGGASTATNSVGSGTLKNVGVTSGSISLTGGQTSGGSGTPISVVQPSLTINYVIKVQNGTLPTIGVLSFGGMTGDIACGSGLLCTGNVVSVTSNTVALTHNHILVGNASNVSSDVAMAGDCSIVDTGIITCLKSNGVSFGTAAFQNVGAFAQVANNLSDLVSASSGRTNLGLGTMATQNSSAVTITGGAIACVNPPVSATDCVNLSYVNSVVAGISTPITAMRVATTAALGNSPAYTNGASGVGAKLTATVNGAISIDGLALSVNDRILVKDQASQFQNGPYFVSIAGSGGAVYELTRVTDADTNTEIVNGLNMVITAGSVNGGSRWQLVQSAAITVGTTALPFFQIATANSSPWAIAGSDITNSNAGAVNITGANVTAGANVKLNGNWLSGDGGNEGVFVTSAGNVGVGTSTPGSVLEVFGGFITGTRSSKSVYLNPNSTASNVFGYIAMEGTHSMDFALSSKDTSPEYLYIKNSGRIGMGTTSPVGQLDVRSNSTSLPSIELSTPDGTKAPGIEWLKIGAVAYNWSIPQDAATYSGKFMLSNSSAGYPGTPLLGVDTAGNMSLVAAGYLNFGTTFGSGGYGFRPNSGAVQYRNSGGSWVNVCQPGNICGVDYGVNCDGTSAMNTPLANAINAVNTANAISPAGLYLPPGVCMVTPGSLPVLTASLYGPDTVFKSNSNISGCLLTAEFLTKAPSVTNDVYVTNFDFGGFVSSQTAAPGNEDGLCVTGAIHSWITVRKAIVLNHGVAIDISGSAQQFTENRVTVKADANNVNLYLKTSAAGGFFSIDANYFDLLTSYQPGTNGVIVQMDADNTHGVTSNQFKFDDMEIGGTNSFGVVAHGLVAGNTFTAYTMRGKNGSGKYFSFDALACQNTVFSPTLLGAWATGDNTNVCAGIPNKYLTWTANMP